MNSLFYFLPTLSYFICNDFKDDGSKKKGVIISQLETNNKQFTKKEKQNGKQEKRYSYSNLRTNCGKTCILNRAILRIVINYTGTSFFTNNSDGYFQEHESLEKARDFLIEQYGTDAAIEVETSVRFSY